MWTLVNSNVSVLIHWVSEWESLIAVWFFGTPWAMAPHSSTLAWKIPWMAEPGRLQSMGSLRVGYDWVSSLSLFTFLHWRKWQPTPVFLPGESQGRGSLVGCRLWGRTESDTTEATKQQQQQGYNLQASLSMEFSRQEYWSGLPFSSPWDLPNLGIKHKSPALQADSLPSESPRKPINKRHF